MNTQQGFSRALPGPAPRMAVLVALGVLVLGGPAWTQDPFVQAANPLRTGWAEVSRIPTTGIFVAGTKAVAWGPAGYQTSEDAGVTWSNPITPGAFSDRGEVQASGGSAVAEAVIAETIVYVRSYDGVVRGADGAPRNQQWGIAAATRIAVSGNGILFVERGDGTGTIAVHFDKATGAAPGRLAFAFQTAAATFDGQSSYAFDGVTAKKIRTESIDGRPPGQYPLATGPGVAVQRGGDASRWVLSGDKLVCEGRAGHPVSLLSYGPAALKGDQSLVGLVRDQTAVAIVSARDQDSLRPNEANAGLPRDVSAVASLGRDPLGTGRFRLLAATPQGIQIYRSE